MNDRSLARSVSVTSEEGGVDWRLRAPVIISTGASPFLVHLPNYLGQLPKNHADTARAWLEFFRASLGSRAFQAKPEPETRASRVQAFQAFQAWRGPKSPRASQAFWAWKEPVCHCFSYDGMAY